MLHPGPLAATQSVIDGLGRPDARAPLRIDGPRELLPSCFLVTTAATASIAAATVLAADLLATRNGDAERTVAIDTRHVAAAIRSEHHLRIDGAAPILWDPLSGDYRAADTWIRLHTNFAHHRAAALRALGLPWDTDDREAVAAVVTGLVADALQDRVEAEGGCGAALRSLEAWRRHPHGRDVHRRPLIAVDQITAAPASRLGAADRPLEGVRVLDLTRVLAGPIAGRFLAAHGAQVLRIDPPADSAAGEDGAGTVTDTVVGKRTARLDLRDPQDRTALDRLLEDTDVVLQAYRPGALAGLGLDPASLAARRPGLVVGVLSAYGPGGPWWARRGFDSLVQLATGLADAGRVAAGADRPVPLPAQLLDHGSGYLLATGVIEALHRRTLGGGSWKVEVALARTAWWLAELGRMDIGAVGPPDEAIWTPYLVELDGPLGRTRHVRCPGSIDGVDLSWPLPPAPLGTHPPAWWG